jgi:hypothetical protein
MNDGLLLNGISGLKLQGPNLWIAYRNYANGAVGTLDLRSHKLSTLTPNLPAAAGANSQPANNQVLSEDPHQAPHLPVSCMTEAEPGEMWFAVREKGLQRFQSFSGAWDTIQQLSARDAVFPAMAADPTRGLLLLAERDTGIIMGGEPRPCGLVLYDYRHNQQELLQIAQGLPSNDLTAVAVDGRIAWVGGRGFVAVVDVQERKVLRIAYVSASRILRIQLSQAHAWIQVSCGTEGDPDYCGNAWTGVYRMGRGAIEPVVHTASR